MNVYHIFLYFFFFNDTATTEIYTLSLHDALPICRPLQRQAEGDGREASGTPRPLSTHFFERLKHVGDARARSEEHTSELQSQSNLVCRLLLEKKKKEHYAWCQSITRLGRRMEYVV